MLAATWTALSLTAKESHWRGGWPSQPSLCSSPLMCDDGLAVTVTVSVSLEGGASETVTLSAEGDAARVAAAVALRHSLDSEQQAALAEDLTEQYADASEKAPPICKPTAWYERSLFPPRC